MERLGLELKTREILQNSSKLDATCICYFRFCTVISCGIGFFSSSI